MNRDKFDILIYKYQHGELKDAEKKLMDQWFDSLASDENRGWTAEEQEALQRKIMMKIDVAEQPAPVRFIALRKWIPYAAAVLLMATVGGMYLWYPRPSAVQLPMISEMEVGLDQENIRPGTNKATLTLADGTTVALSEAYAGIVTEQGAIKYADGNILFAEEQMGAEIPYATLAIPRGGQYQIVLPDGSKVWLNSASTLKYPLQFDEHERAVELEGEAYFDVAHQHSPSGDRIPFMVTTAHQTVEVLGTTFNVAAYVDEADTKTTLVSGEVRVVRSDTKQSSMLRPGEESVIYGSSGIQVKPVNVEAATAWKSGIFYFDETSSSQMLKQISRWYNIEIIYEGTPPKEVFTGKMSRNVNLGVLLKFLKDSGINLHLEGEKLIVKK